MRLNGRRALMGLVARAALVPAAAFAVHQLRFVLAYGRAASVQLAYTGHSYLHSLVPWVVLLIALAAGSFLWALGRVFAGQRSASRYKASFAASWLACAVCLLLIYGVQESLEGVFATGHPAGAAGILGHGGWWAIPAAAGVGLVLATIFHGARRALDEIARRVSPAAINRRRESTAPLRPRAAVIARLPSLAEGWSGRGPPR